MKTAIVCTATFVVTLLASLLQSFLTTEPRASLSFDSRHYLESCRQMVMLWGAFWQHGPAGLRPDPWFSDYLILDGPILPMLSATAFIAVGRSPAQTEWPVLVCLQGMVHALSAVLVYLLAHRLTGSKKWALPAGLAWGLYPPAILSAGRFLTEPLATVFLLGLVLTLGNMLKDRGTLKAALGSGLLDGALFLFKPALLPLWIAMNALVIAAGSSWRDRFKALALLACGFALVVAPWVATTKVLTGRMYLLPQREPVHNMAKGCDTEIDGWSCLPDPPLTAVYSTMESPVAVFMAAAATHPLELLQMTLRKPERIFAMPWNDFRQTALGVSPEAQKWLQVVLCLLAVFGALAFLCRRRRAALDGSPLPAEMTFTGFASIVGILGHLTYLPFEAITRYGFTAMPFVVVLAVYLLFWLRQRRLAAAFAVAVAVPTTVLVALLTAPPILIPPAVAWTGSFDRALSVYGAACGAALAVVILSTWRFFRRCEPDAPGSRLFGAAFLGMTLSGFAMLAAQTGYSRDYMEWTYLMAPGQSATRTIAMDEKTGERPVAAFVMIDGDRGLSDAAVTLNGCPVGEPPDSVNRFSASRYPLFNLMGTYAGYLDEPVERMRQWRLVPVPLSCVRGGGDNVISVKAGETPVTVYGDYWEAPAGRRRPILSMDYFSPGKFCNAMSDFEGRLYSQTAELCKTGTGDGAKGDYRIFLVLGYRRPGGEARGLTETSPAPQSYSRALGSGDFDEQMRREFEGEAVLRVNRAVLRHARSTAARVALPQLFAEPGFVRVSVSGELRSGAGVGLAGILCVLEGGGEKPATMVLASTPPALSCGPKWRRFTISEVVPTAALPGGLRALQVGLYPGRWRDVSEYGPARRGSDFMVRNLNIEAQSVQRPDIDGLRLSIF